MMLANKGVNSVVSTLTCYLFMVGQTWLHHYGIVDEADQKRMLSQNIRAEVRLLLDLSFKVTSSTGEKKQMYRFGHRTNGNCE